MKVLSSPKFYISLALLVGIASIGVASFRIHDATNPIQSAAHKGHAALSVHKQYCDTLVHACFAYPASWQSPEVLSAGTLSFGDRFSDPAHTLGGELDILPLQATASSTFYTVTSEVMSGVSKDVLIGGYYTGGSAVSSGSATTVPAYYLVGSSQVDQYDLVPGSSQPAPANLGVSAPNGNVVRFVCGAATNSTGQEWFSSAAALTCKNLLQSFYFQQ